MAKTKTQVLLIEDNPADVVFLREALNQDALAVFHQIVVESLAEALERLALQAFDAALLDLGLPDSQGLATFLSLHQVAPELPVVVLSALDDEEVAQQAVRAGAQDYLVKRPWEFPSAGRAVRYAIERQKSEQRFSRIFHASPTPQYITKLGTGQIVDVNGAFVRLLGYAREEMIDHTTLELGIWAQPEDRANILQDLQRSCSVQDREIELRTRCGEKCTMIASAELINLRGEPCVLASTVDITERRRAELALQKNDRLLRLFVEHSPAAIAMFDRDMRYIVASHRYLTDYRLGEQNLVGRSHYEVFPEMDEARKAIHRRGLAGDVVKCEEDALPRLDGTFDWLRYELRPWYEAGGDIGGVIFFSEVITERKRAETARIDSERRLRLALETTSDGFWIVDANGRFRDVNPAYCAMSGYSRDEFLQLNISNVEVLEDIETTAAHIRKIEQEGGDRFETKHRRKDGSVFDVEVSVNLLDSASGLMICFLRDITERKRGETLLNQRIEDLALENKLNDAVNHGEDINQITNLLAAETKNVFGCQYATMYLIDPDTHTLVLQQFTISQEVTEKIERLIGRPIPQVSLPIGGNDHFSRVLASDRGLLITGNEGVNQWLADFTNTRFLPSMVRPLILKIIPAAVKLLNIRSVISIPLKAGNETLGLIEFVTEGVFDEGAIERLQNVRHQLADVIIRKRTEESLRESNEKYRLLSEELEKRVKERTAQVQDLYDNAPAGYHSLDKNGCFLEVNQTELNWLGYPRDEVIGRPLMDFVTEASVSTFKQNFPGFLQRGWVRDLECEFIRKNGTTFYTLVSATAIKDIDGNYLMSRSTVVDITERKQVDLALRQSEAQLRASRDQLSVANDELEKAARMKDEFLASMSHELRTPLTGILVFSEGLQEQVYGPLNEQQLRALENIETSGRHLLDLINDILDVAKLEAGMLELEIETCALSPICQASLQLVKGMAQRKNQKLSFSMVPEDVLLQADPRRFKQILVNLLSNAVKYTPVGGSLGLEVAEDEIEHLLQISVWDGGIGIKPEHLDKLFQPFVQLDSSLSREQTGTGLGLTLVQHLVDLHGGTISVQSTFGEGSRFTITVPRAFPATSKSAVKTTSESIVPQSAAIVTESNLALEAGVESTPWPGAPLILVVDDNEANRKAMCDFLSARNYRVAAAGNAAEFFDQISQERPDVVLMDIQMPGMGGLEAIRRVRAHPDTYVARLPIIALTALAMSDDREKCIAAGADEYLSKPVRLRNLVEVIQTLVNENG